MSEGDVNRRLAAIMAVDVVGYSRLMNLDEASTHTEVSTCLETIVEAAISQHKGRTVKSTGDGLLAEFPSAVEGVQCAVDIQRAMADRGRESAADEHRVQFRIGVNLGDIIIEDHDIFGDGVNIAARIEALCDPGGVMISRSVFDQTEGKLDVTMDDMGEHAVKNIVHPVHIFRVQFDGAPAAGISKPAKPAVKRLRLWMAFAAVVVAMAFAAMFMQQREAPVETASSPAAVALTAEKPVVSFC